MPASTHSNDSPSSPIPSPSYKTISIKKLHPTFVAEVTGVNFSNKIGEGKGLGVSEEQMKEIKDAMAIYGVLVLRDTGLDDKEHIEFSRGWGELDDIRPYIVGGRKMRYSHYELFDAGNLDDEGKILKTDSVRAHYGKGNVLFHVDSSFNPRRASYSLLKAYTLPPRGTGGNTDFLDTRTAFEQLPNDLKQELLDNDHVAAHSLFHSRKLGSPEYFKDLNPLDHPMHRHKIVQLHEPSGRMNLYIGTHIHHIEDVSAKKSAELFAKLMKHATSNRYFTSVAWENVGDLVIWDNTCVMHRAAGGSFEGKFKRDMRRTTVHDDSTTAWGLNASKDLRPGFHFS